jgi:hypothetical protein
MTPLTPVCRDKMYCSLTCHLMNKNLASIEKHIQGKKYRRAKGEHPAHVSCFMLSESTECSSVSLCWYLGTNCAFLQSSMIRENLSSSWSQSFLKRRRVRRRRWFIPCPASLAMHASPATHASAVWHIRKLTTADRHFSQCLISTEARSTRGGV